jgi:hypothetical protein
MTARSNVVLTALAFWLAGLLLAHGPMIFSGFRRIQQERTDSRLMHYMLEHGYRWVSGDRLHASFWDPPVFYPARNTAAMSETLVGTGPLYWIWRMVRVPSDLAYALWLLGVSSVNFLAFFLLLRQIFDRSPAASGFGAFLFSFASMRLAHVGHPQLLAGFYLVLVVHGALRSFRETTLRGQAPWIGLASAAFVAQVYSGFYVAWFLALSLALVIAWSFALPSVRPAAVAAVRSHGAGLALGAAAAGVCLLPFLIHSLKAATDVGYRGYDEVELFLPRWHSWFFFGTDHALYGDLAELPPFNSVPQMFEQPISPGLVTMVLAGLGLWGLRSTVLGRILAAVSLTLLVCTVMLPGGYSVWGLFYLTVPGAQAIRAVSRVSLILLLPVAVGAASFVDGGRWRKPLLIGAALLAMLEQARSTPALDRFALREATVEAARRIQPGMDAFFLSEDQGGREYASLLDSLPLRVHVDAMMVSLEAGVPTINGYSGAAPPGWPFEGLSIMPRHAPRAFIEAELTKWCREKGIDRQRVQWIQVTR